jgi:uncharacterized protein
MNAVNHLPEITERIVNASQPEKIILFGSFARGDFDPDSDLDLLVVISGVDRPRTESTRLRGVLRGLLVPVDIVVVTPEQLEELGEIPGMIYRTALREGKVVYERAGA